MAGSKYLLIISRDPFESNDIAHAYGLARGLKGGGDDVTVFLVQNGVLPARAGTSSNAVADLAGAGIEVLADDLSLKERGIGADRLVDGVSASPLDVVIDHMAGGAKTIWH